MKALSSLKTVQILFAILMISLVFSSIQLGKLNSRYSMQQFYPSQHPLLIQDQKIRQTFRLIDKNPLLYVIYLKDQNSWLQKNQIEKLRKLTLQLGNRKDLANVISLTSIEIAQQEKNELLIGSLFDRIPEKQWPAAIRANPLISSQLITTDFKSTLLVLEPKENLSTEALNEALTSTIQKTFPKAQVISAGAAVVQLRLSALVKSEMFRFLVLAIGIFCFLFFLFFSNLSAVAGAFGLLVSTNIFVLGSLSFLKIPMNIVLVTLPIIVSVAILSLYIHTLHLWAQKEVEKDPQKKWLQILAVMQELLLPNFLGSVTTSLGFFALMTTSIPIIKEYGAVVAVMVLLAFVFAMNVIALLLFVVKPQMRKWFEKPATWATWSLRNQKLVLITIPVLGVAAIFMHTKLNFSGRLFDDLPVKDGVRASMEWMDSSLGGVVGYDLSLIGVQTDFWKSPSRLTRLQNLAVQLRKHPDIGSVIVLPDFFPNHQVPSSAAAVAENFFMFSMAEHNPISQLITEDAKQTRLAIRMKDNNGQQILKSQTWVRQNVSYFFPEVKMEEAGLAKYSHAMNQTISKQLIFGFWDSIILIGLFLVFVFRSIKWSVLACIPNLVPPALMIGLMAVTEVNIKPAVALIFSIALGFAFNNTVYLLSRYRRNLLIRDQSSALREAMLVEGNPCLFESMIMFLGFSVFLISDFKGNRIFGEFMMLSIFTGFVADLFFLPALIQVSSKFNFISMKAKIKSYPIEAITKTAASFLLMCVFIFPSLSRSDEIKVENILKRSQILLDAKDDQAMVQMQIIEANKEIKNRQLQIKTLRTGGFSVLAKIKAPADLKGMGFLGKIQNGKESQWIYLPSSGQVRRVVTGKTKAGLLGSEVSPEDLNSSMVKSAATKLVKNDKDYFLIQLTPVKGASIYSSIISKIDKKSFLPIQASYYLEKDLVKTVQFQNYVKLGTTFRAKKIEVKNFKNGRGTILTFSEMKVNSGLKEKNFSESALKDN